MDEPVGCPPLRGECSARRSSRCSPLVRACVRAYARGCVCVIRTRMTRMMRMTRMTRMMRMTRTTRMTRILRTVRLVRDAHCRERAVLVMRSTRRRASAISKCAVIRVSLPLSLARSLARVCAISKCAVICVSLPRSLARSLARVCAPNTCTSPPHHVTSGFFGWSATRQTVAEPITPHRWTICHAASSTLRGRSSAPRAARSSHAARAACMSARA